MDELKEHCGVAGVYLSGGGDGASKLVYYALQSLQHRGQESAGIAVSDGERIEHYKNMGLVSEVFDRGRLAELKGHIAIGHTLYSTSGRAAIENAQPFVSRSKLGTVAVAHNGSLVNTEPMREFLEETGSSFTSTSDSEVIIKLIAKNYKKGLERAITDTIQLIKGSFALCVMTEQKLIGVRDPNGIRPLCLGKVQNGWMLASESCAIDAVGGDFVRDIDPGEIERTGDSDIHYCVFGKVVGPGDHLSINLVDDLGAGLLRIGVRNQGEDILLRRSLEVDVDSDRHIGDCEYGHIDSVYVDAVHRIVLETSRFRIDWTVVPGSERKGGDLVWGRYLDLECYLTAHGNGTIDRIALRIEYLHFHVRMSRILVLLERDIILRGIVAPIPCQEVRCSRRDDHHDRDDQDQHPLVHL